MPTEKDFHDLQHYFSLKLKAETQMTDVFRQVRDGKDAFVLLDTRSRNSFNKGHIPGALSTPQNEADAWIGGLDRNRTYVTYCYGETWHLSAKAALQLAGQGIYATEMNAGMLEWEERKYPLHVPEAPVEGIKCACSKG